MPSSPIKLTSQVKFRHSSSKLQLHSRTQKSCALFCHFMALILTPFSFQRIWKLFLNNYFQTDGVVTVSDILTFFRSCTPGQLKLMSQVSKLVRLLVVMPAMNAESEQSFSAVRRIKTYLCTTMSQRRLNHLILLHVHKSLTDGLNLVDIASDFIAGNDHRKNIFGTEFKPSAQD